MAADFDMVKAAAVAVLAVISAVVNITTDVSVCIHNKKTSFFVLLLFLTKRRFLFIKTFYFLKNQHRNFIKKKRGRVIL